MKVTEKDVAYVADLANLDLSEEERAAMLRDLNSILGHIDRLSQLEMDDLALRAQGSEEFVIDRPQAGSEANLSALREDVREGLRKSLPQKTAVQNAPDTDGTFFEVPKVIER